MVNVTCTASVDEPVLSAVLAATEATNPTGDRYLHLAQDAALANWVWRGARVGSLTNSHTSETAQATSGDHGNSKRIAAAAGAAAVLGALLMLLLLPLRVCVRCC